MDCQFPSYSQICTDLRNIRAVFFQNDFLLVVDLLAHIAQGLETAFHKVGIFFTVPDDIGGKRKYGCIGHDVQLSGIDMLLDQPGREVTGPLLINNEIERQGA